MGIHKVRIDLDKCIGCGACVRVCAAQNMEFVAEAQG